MKWRLRMMAVAAAAMACMAGAAGAATIDTLAKQAVLIDMTSGTTLFEKNADQRMPTSSMSKVMTGIMVFERIREGKITLEDTLPVSKKAWQMQGSKMWVDIGTDVKVEDLLRGMIIQSGNDACIVLAEGLAGSEEAFAKAMTERAHAIGMKDTNLVNASGWPDDNHYSTAHDLAIMATYLIREFPEHYKYYSEKEYTYHGIKQGNRNPLLYRGIDVDGVKTGHTDAAGYGLIASAERQGRRLLLVVNGLPSMQARADESAKLLEWGFREFETNKLFAKGEAVATAATWYGRDEQVPLVPAEDVSVTMQRGAKGSISAKVKMMEPIAAPIAAGQQLGTLIVTANDVKPIEVPLIAGQAVERMGPVARALAGAQYLMKSGLQ
ncbi:MAG TPA: D-alanyl-D-alanine carboxypeptidase family protein [Alphaproteobacteria bacterium]|nr:D-alanyl-D-alanine carboxypeptidase family protein [Alphaproteobacteria bacterium]